MTRSTPTVTLMVAMLFTTADSFSFEPVSNSFRTTPLTTKLGSKRTICNAKLNKIASNYDLDTILSSEKEFAMALEEGTPVKMSRGRKSNNEQKKKMKQQMKQQKQEMQQMKQKQRTGSSTATYRDEENDEAILGGAYEKLIQNIDFSVYQVPPSLGGKRIDAVLVDLLNMGKDDSDSQSSNPISISRSQCGTLLLSECVFVVPPGNADEFNNVWRADDVSKTVPLALIEHHGTPIQRKSHMLEPSSIIIYPSRNSLLSTSTSSTLLSNFLSPTKIIAQNIPLDILYEDEHMIVINKQADMVVHPAAGNWDGTIVNALAYYLMNESPFGAGELFVDDATGGVLIDSCMASNEVDVNQNDAVTNSISTLRPGIVHRLDKGTTGVLVVAKTSSALATLSESFADRKVKKQYLAVAIGNTGTDQWIDKPISRHPLHRQRMRVVPNPSKGQTRFIDTYTSNAKHGRPALSHIHTIFHDGKLSIVQVRIATGRTHQIRVHLQDHGTPIYGDAVYGMADWNKVLSAKRGITRPLLHAQRLEIDHPVTGETLVFEAPVANDMLEVINAILPAGEKLSSDASSTS